MDLSEIIIKLVYDEPLTIDEIKYINEHKQDLKELEDLFFELGLDKILTGKKWKKD